MIDDCSILHRSIHDVPVQCCCGSWTLLGLLALPLPLSCRPFASLKLLLLPLRQAHGSKAEGSGNKEDKADLLLLLALRNCFNIFLPLIAAIVAVHSASVVCSAVSHRIEFSFSFLTSDDSSGGGLRFVRRWPPRHLRPTVNATLGLLRILRLRLNRSTQDMRLNCPALEHIQGEHRDPLLCCRY